MTELVGYLNKIKDYIENQNNDKNLDELIKSINDSLDLINKRLVTLEKEVRNETPYNKEKNEEEIKFDKLLKWCDFMAECNHILFLLDNNNNNYYCCTQTKYNYGPHNFTNRSKFNSFEDTLRIFPGEAYCIYEEPNYKIYLINKNKIKNFHTLVLPKINSSIKKMVSVDKFVNLNIK